MPITIEVNLKVPSLTVRPADGPPQRIDNNSLRFSKRMEVPAIPKPGDTLMLNTEGGEPFAASVTRAGWSDEKELFIVACRYANRSIPQAEYNSLVNDTDWVVTQLP